MAASTAFVGRQPIHDANSIVCAYELLFRDSERNSAHFSDLDQACRTTIVDSLMDIGLDRLVGKNRAFINMSMGAVLDQYSHLFPKERVVLEILESAVPTTEFVGAVRALTERGYAIALDDFLYRPDLEPLLELADIVKVDVLGVDQRAIAAQVKQLVPFGVQLLAEKVETREMYEFCKQLGFSLFQGYYFCKPVIVSGKRVTPNRLSAMRLLARLQDEKAGPPELEEVIRQDVSLSYKLLRYMNSAFFALPTKIDSTKRALVLLGTTLVRRWASLLVISESSQHSNELIQTSMTRARMCELLAKPTRLEPEVSFTVGLLSTLDALMEQSMDSLLGELPLAENVKAALLRHEGPMGRVLKLVLDYERGNWKDVCLDGVPDTEILKAYLDALAWSEDATAALRAADDAKAPKVPPKAPAKAPMRR